MSSSAPAPAISTPFSASTKPASCSATPRRTRGASMWGSKLGTCYFSASIFNYYAWGYHLGLLPISSTHGCPNALMGRFSQGQESNLYPCLLVFQHQKRLGSRPLSQL